MLNWHIPTGCVVLSSHSGLSIPGAEKSVTEVSSRERRERGRGLGGGRSAIAGLPGRIPVLRAMAASLLQSSSLVAARRTGLDLYGVQFGPHLELELVSSSSCCRRSPLQAGSASSSPPPATLHGECTKSVLVFPTTGLVIEHYGDLNVAFSRCSGESNPETPSLQVFRLV